MEVEEPNQISVQDQIRRKEARLRALQVKNEQADKELEILNRKLDDIRVRKASEVKSANLDKATSKAKLAATRLKLEKNQNTVDTLNLFLVRIGLTIGYGEHYEGIEFLKSIHFKGLTKTGEDCVLHFSALDLPVFKVTAANPQFREFDDLAAEANKSQNFVYLLMKAREYFLQYIEKYCSNS